MGYVEHMQEKTRKRLSSLYSGVESVILTDFPDNSNIGDAALTLGEKAYWDEAGIAVESVYAHTTLDTDVYRGTVPVVINGGGNFGGLYPWMSRHRYSMAERLRSETLLIQAPQSVHFTGQAEKEEFARRMAGREQLRIAVRDLPSRDELLPLFPRVQMSPDSVHALGHLDAKDPVRKVSYLLRVDRESAGLGHSFSGESVDWPDDSRLERAGIWMRWRARRYELTRRLANRSVAAWFGRAQLRFDLGVEILEASETVVTDRLHAMLISLQMGRRVVALENSNKKLSNYAEAWFGPAEPNVIFAKDLDEAQRLAGN